VAMARDRYPMGTKKLQDVPPGKRRIPAADRNDQRGLLSEREEGLMKKRNSSALTAS